MAERRHIDKPYKAVELKIYLTPRASGTPLVSAQLKFTCGTKQNAIDLIQSYIDHAYVKKETN